MHGKLSLFFPRDLTPDPFPNKEGEVHWEFLGAKKRDFQAGAASCSPGLVRDY